MPSIVLCSKNDHSSNCVIHCSPISNYNTFMKNQREKAKKIKKKNTSGALLIMLKYARCSKPNFTIEFNEVLRASLLTSTIRNVHFNANVGHVQAFISSNGKFLQVKILPGEEAVQTFSLQLQGHFSCSWGDWSRRESLFGEREQKGKSTLETPEWKVGRGRCQGADWQSGGAECPASLSL